MDLDFCKVDGQKISDLAGIQRGKDQETIMSKSIGDKFMIRDYMIFYSFLTILL